MRVWHYIRLIGTSHEQYLLYVMVKQDEDPNADTHRRAGIGKQKASFNEIKLKTKITWKNSRNEFRKHTNGRHEETLRENTGWNHVGRKTNTEEDGVEIQANTDKEVEEDGRGQNELTSTWGSTGWGTGGGEEVKGGVREGTEKKHAGGTEKQDEKHKGKISK